MSVGCSKVWLTAGRNGAAPFSTLHAVKERLALGRDNGGLTRGTGTPQGLSAQQLLYDLPGFSGKRHFHADKWNFWALLEVLLSFSRCKFRLLCKYVCSQWPAEPEWKKKPNSKLPLHLPSLGELGWCSSDEADCLQRHAARSKRCCNPASCLWGAGV